MKALISLASNFEHIIKLIDAIIWPLTLLVIIFMFRKNFREAFKRLGSLKADATGIEMTFDRQIENTKILFDTLKPQLITKNTNGLKTSVNQSESPYQQILDVRSSIINFLKLKADEAGVITESYSSAALANRLNEVTTISSTQTSMIQAMLKITDNLDTNVTSAQAHEIMALFNKIEID